MPQETNLNVAPYFDDFEPSSNYYKVLYKPGLPVQARELTTMQSILQNQIEDMGNHVFKEGAKVIPGGSSFKDQFFGIQVDTEFLGVPVTLYLDQLVGKQIRGASSQVTAQVITYITDEESDRGTCTLYVAYRGSGINNDINTFLDNEVLETIEDISFSTTFIAAGEGFASTIASNAAVIGMAFQMSAGVYFLRGYFVDVKDQVLILDQYSNTSSHRVGFKVTEDIISADIDPSLSDNAQGFNNFTAPGADRLRITATLARKDLDELNDENFVQLTEVINGALEKDTVITEYNHLNDELARRTYDESGNYYCKDFTTSCRECLNDGVGNRGLYDEGQITDQGNEPSDALMVYKVSPGKAYVRGYYVELLRASNFDVVKPRQTNSLKNQSVNFGFGPSFRMNNVSGSPTLGFNNSNTISLRSERVGSESRPNNSSTFPHIAVGGQNDAGHVGAAGSEIGIARLYDFALESGSYNTAVPSTNEWDISLWDLQMYTTFKVNTPVTLSIPTHIKGQSSGATGFLRYSCVGTGFTAYDVQGTFFPGERLSFNGVNDNDRFTVDIHNYEISDIGSLYGSVGVATFTGDLIPKQVISFGNGTVGAAVASAGIGKTSGISQITSAGDTFAGIVTTGDLIRYKRPGKTLPTLNKVIGVFDTSVNVIGVTSVAGVVDGGVPQTQEEVSNLQLVGSRIQDTTGSGNKTDNESLYSVFPKRNIQFVDLISSNLVVRKQFDVTITNRRTSIVNSDDREVFLPFDEERYTLISTDGSTIPITASKFKLTNGSKSLQFRGLNVASGNAKLITTLRRSNLISKTKIKKVSENVDIVRSSDPSSGIGGDTLNDGLTFGNFAFGTRVQDDIISLNVPDVVKIFGIFESDDLNDATAPTLNMGSMDGPNSNTNDLIIGERFVGENSGAVAIYVTRNSDIGIAFIYLNDAVFDPGEIIKFKNSKVTAIVTLVTSGSSNITQNFTFQTGQEGSFYGISNITRKSDIEAPSRRLKIYYARGTYDNSDVGDITTVNSYNSFDYGKEITRVNGDRLSDIIDARPVVGTYTVAEGARSPFEFLGRNFDDSANNGARHSSKNILASDESMSVGFNYYLPRADRLYIDKLGTLQVVYGTPSDDPQLPPEINGSMNIANVFLPAFLYKTSDAKIKFVQYKRYQMSDISKLEQRIKNLEYYTSLNTVESDILNKFIPDGNGLNRFKSGIFVDNFTDLKPQDTNVGVRNSVDKKQGILRPSHYNTAINMQVGSNAIQGIGNELSTDSRFASIMGQNVKRTGNLITLDYNEVQYKFQPYATRVENVTPFLVMFYRGSIELEPDTDIWIDVTKMRPNDIMMEGSFEGVAEALGAEVTTSADGTRMGNAPLEWNSWETVGVSMNLGLSNSQQTLQNSSGNSNNAAVQGLLDGINVGNEQILDPSDSIVNNITATGGVSLQQQRSGSQKTVIEQIDTASLGSRVVRRDIVHFMRSRDIEFTAKSMKPYNRVYAFFDGVDITKFCVPKLIEIEMIRGTFRTGENVRGRLPRRIRRRNRNARAEIDFRVAQPRHKYGPHRRRTDSYTRSPYDRKGIPANYSSSSSILNVDTASLASDDTPQYEGYISKGMILRGRSSGARARVKNVRLIADVNGTLIGSFHVPDSSSSRNPIFETGTSTFRLTGSKTNSKVKGTFDTAAEETFYSQGSVDATQESTLSMRNAKVLTSNFNDSQTIGGTSQSNTIQTVSGFDVITNVTQDVTEITNITNEITNVTNEFITNVTEVTEVTNVTNVTNVTEVTEVTEVTNVTNVQEVTQVIQQPWESDDDDPIAQTFSVTDDTGVFVTKCDIYFQAKDDELPVKFEIRTTELGTPTTTILPYSEVYKNPDEVFLSQDGSVPTTFQFKSPVYLEPQTEYALVLKSKITNYKVWIARLGEADVRTTNREAGQVLVTKQPTLGSLFKSQNSSVWTPSQYEDLKYDLYRADFRGSGSITFYNPKLPRKLEDLPNKGISFKPNKVRVGLGQTFVNSGITTTGFGLLKVGNTIFQANTNTPSPSTLETVPHGSLVGFAGSLTAVGSNRATLTGGSSTLLTVTDGGVGYTPLGNSVPGAGSANQTFTGVPFTTITGLGQNAEGTIVVTNGSITQATVTTGGSGYTVGDVLTATIGTEETGSGLRLTVSAINIGEFNELVLSDVQGDFDASASAFPLKYIDSTLGISTSINYRSFAAGGPALNGEQDVSPTSVTVADGDDGLHFRIRMKNHGMYNSINKVTISGIESDLVPSVITENYNRNTTSNLDVKVGSAYTTFEGLTVGAGQTGYILIDDEILGYTGVSGNTLTGISRGIDGSERSAHDNGDIAYKYEFGGISLRRINKTHDLADVTIQTDPIGLDFFHIKVDTASDGVNRSSAQWDPTDASTKLPLKIKSKGVGGGPDARSTYNIPFSLIIPKFELLNPTGTNITAKARTITGTTVNGIEPAFQDQGFTPVSMFEPTYFPSVRQVASQVNEDAFLTDLPGNKSLSMLMNMSSSDRRLSPMINLDHAAITFVNNRINSPVTSYQDDLRVNSVRQDPNRFFYVTKNIVLENPATSLEVIIDGYVPDICDLRVFYAINQDKKIGNVVFTPFPGFKNININGNVITQTNSDGLSNLNVPKVDRYVQTPTINLFKEYNYSTEDLSPFNMFRIKIIGTSTNAAVVPQLRNLRVTALA